MHDPEQSFRLWPKPCKRRRCLQTSHLRHHAIDGATPLLVDNEAAIAMVNESRPTPRARHIEIQHFAIQEWRNKGDVVLRHCPGILNVSDDLTKALGWVLHSRHARRSMGHFKIGSPNGSAASP